MIQKHNIVSKEVQQDFKYTKCEKKFTHKKNMLRHLKTHPQMYDDDHVDNTSEVIFMVIFINNFEFNNECI